MPSTAAVAHCSMTAKDYLLKHNIAGPMRSKSFISKEGMVVLDAGRYA